jgi:fido (protein-threonine AMPylation protein)
MEGWRELHNEELSQALFSWAGIIRESQIKEDEVGGI